MKVPKQFVLPITFIVAIVFSGLIIHHAIKSNKTTFNDLLPVKQLVSYAMPAGIVFIIVALYLFYVVYNSAKTLSTARQMILLLIVGLVGSAIALIATAYKVSSSTLTESSFKSLIKPLVNASFASSTLLYITLVAVMILGYNDHKDFMRIEQGVTEEQKQADFIAAAEAVKRQQAIHERAARARQKPALFQDNSNLSVQPAIPVVHKSRHHKKSHRHGHRSRH